MCTRYCETGKKAQLGRGTRMEEGENEERKTLENEKNEKWKQNFCK